MAISSAKTLGSQPSGAADDVLLLRPSENRFVANAFFLGPALSRGMRTVCTCPRCAKVPEILVEHTVVERRQQRGRQDQIRNPILQGLQPFAGAFRLYEIHPEPGVDH